MDDDRPQTRKPATQPAPGPAATRRETPNVEQLQHVAPKIKIKKKPVLPVVAHCHMDRHDIESDSEGFCFISNRPTPLRRCQLVDRSVDRETLTKLEYVWEMGYQQFRIDRRRNVFLLRADWQFLFEHATWFLIPEPDVLQTLSKIYLHDKRTTSNLSKLFTQRTYRYYVLPLPAFDEPICRSRAPDKRDHDVHLPPYPKLGPLESHLYPHLVVFRTGRTLANLPEEDVTEMADLLAQVLPLRDAAAPEMLRAIQRLYTAWTEADVPDDFCSPTAPQIESDPSELELLARRARRAPPERYLTYDSESDSDSESESESDVVSRSRSDTDSEAESLHLDDVIEEDDTAWIEYIHNWKKDTETAVRSGGHDHASALTHDDDGDDQLAAYVDERARTPPSPNVWNNWKPAWSGRRARRPGLSDRSKFSSNDWAVYKNDVYLTRSGRSRKRL